jgi:hypothetical protein
MAGKQDARVVVSGHGKLTADVIAVGYKARAEATVREQDLSDADMRLLINELAHLRRAMMQEAVEAESSGPDQAISISAIANAEKSATAGDAPATLGHLKSAGKWAWDIATKIGVSVAAKALETAMGM